MGKTRIEINYSNGQGMQLITNELITECKIRIEQAVNNDMGITFNSDECTVILPAAVARTASFVLRFVTD